MSTISILNGAPEKSRSYSVPTADFGPNNFDFIRLFAATQVVIFHGLHHLGIEAPAWSYLFKPFSGVPIFFVVSGFLVTASYERSSSLRSYVEKRARRILPGLWFCIVMTGVVLLALGYPILSAQGATWFASQFAALIYTPDFLRSFGFGSYNGSLWTIPIELQFYVTVPILSLVVARVADKTVVLIAVLLVAMFVGIGIRIYAPSLIGALDGVERLQIKLIRYSFVTHYFLFVLGATAFYLSLHLQPWMRGKGLFWLLPLLAMHLFAPYSATAIVVSQIILGLLTISVAFPEAGAIRLKGYDISYGVYLFHGLILNILVILGFTGASIGIYILLLSSYAAGYVSWTMVEARFLKRGRTHPPLAAASGSAVASSDESQ
jgi:peptidoglycan/LPS O-acetylase OafA/YrhL